MIHTGLRACFALGTLVMAGMARADPTYDVTLSGNVLTITHHATSTVVIRAMTDGASNDQTVYIPGDSGALTPSISSNIVDDGIDLTYTFTNSGSTPARTGFLVIPGITGGLSGSALDTRALGWCWDWRYGLAGRRRRAAR